MTEEQLKILISEDTELVKLLKIIESFDLKDCWLCAGTIRNFVWDSLSRSDSINFSTDIDVVFHDKELSYEETTTKEFKIKKMYPEYDWEIKNQIFMHIHNPQATQYDSSYDAISKFPETCTAIGVRLINNKLELIAPHGIEDLINFKVIPTPFFKENEERMKLYHTRVTSKNWAKRWPKLIIHSII